MCHHYGGRNVVREQRKKMNNLIYESLRRLRGEKIYNMDKENIVATTCGAFTVCWALCLAFYFYNLILILTTAHNNSCVEVNGISLVL